MGNNPRPVNSLEFIKLLPPFYAKGQGVSGVSGSGASSGGGVSGSGGDRLFLDFLLQFEEMFDGLQAAIVGDDLTLTYINRARASAEEGAPFDDYTLVVEPFDAGRLGYPKNALVYIPGNADTTLLAEPIGANSEGESLVHIKDKKFYTYLKPGSTFIVKTCSGLAGLASTKETPSPAFGARDEKDKLAYLQYLASWVGLPVRSDKLVRWNRRFLREAMALDNEGNNPLMLRSTLPGIRAMLNAWHKGEIVPQETYVTDLVSPENGVDTVFRVGDCRIGIDTLLGEGQAGRFHVYLTVNPNDVTMRDPKNIEAMIAAARLILDMEKPVNTEYVLHIKATTMQIAPESRVVSPKEAAAAAAATSAAAAEAAAVLAAKAAEAELAMKAADAADAELAAKAAWAELTAEAEEAELAAEEEAMLLKNANTYARVGITTLLWD